MSGLQGIVSRVSVNLQNKDYSIVAGSFAYRSGNPERDVKGTDGGETVFSENYEEAYGMVKFELYSTNRNLKLVRSLEKLKSIRVKFNDDSGFTRTMESGVTMNDDEKALGADGKITVTIKGTPIE